MLTTSAPINIKFISSLSALDSTATVEKQSIQLKEKVSDILGADKRSKA